jgi:hypothetical protein
MTRGLWGVGTHLPAPVYSFDWSTSRTALTNNPFSIASLDDRMAWLTLRTTLPNVRYWSEADIRIAKSIVCFVPHSGCITRRQLTSA